MRVLKHVLVVLLALFCALGLPALRYADVAALVRGDVDAVSRPTSELPEQPSGNFVIYLSRDGHGTSLDQWRAFFSEEDYGVLLEDVHCLVIDGDETGAQLAERFRARLVKDQMTVRRENGVLVASRLEAGQADLVLLSREMAALWQLDGLSPAGFERMILQEDAP